MVRHGGARKELFQRRRESRSLRGGPRGRAVPALLLLAAALAAPGAAAAADSPPAGSLLGDAPALVAWLKDRNMDLLAAAARVDQASADLSQVRLHPNPELGAGVSDVPLGATNPPGLGPGQTYIYEASLSQTVEIGKRGPRIASARLRLEAERQSYLDALARKTAEARYALGRVVYLTARRSMLEESLSAARENLDLQRTRLENGDLSGNDFDRLKVDTVILESEVAATGRELQSATADCGAVLFAPCDGIEGNLEQLGSAAPVPDAPDVEAALRKRPDLEALRLDRDSARQDAVLGRRRRIPDPSFTLAYIRDNLVISGDQPRTVQLGISLPLPVFDRGQHEAERAEQRAVELDRSARGEEERGRAEVTGLLERKASLEDTLRSLNADAVPHSREVLESTRAAVNRGGMSMTDLLLARRTHTDLMLKVMDLQFDLFSVRNDLRRALGLDLEDVSRAPGS